MIKKNAKISDTSIRVLETLKIFSGNAASIQDILNYFEKVDPENRVYTSEVILKYINTLKVFGLRFVKKKDKYVLLNSPCQIELNEENLKSIYLLEQCAAVFPEEKVRTETNKFLNELEKRFSDNTKILAHDVTKPEIINIELNYEKYSKQIKEYEKYCDEAQRLKITCKNSQNEVVSITVDPNEIKYKDKEVYLNVYSPLLAQLQDINFNDIVEIKQLPTKSNPMNMLSATTFKLKNPLSKTYKLHHGEKLLKMDEEGNAIILNQKEDRTLLLKRLMRYGACCEVISPKTLRDEMCELIDATLRNYCN